METYLCDLCHCAPGIDFVDRSWACNPCREKCLAKLTLEQYPPRKGITHAISDEPRAWLNMPISLFKTNGHNRILWGKTPEFPDFDSQVELRRIIDASPLLAYIQNGNVDADHLNEACLEYSGCTRAQHLGRGWLTSVYPEDREMCIAAIGGAFERRRIHEVKFRWRRANGSYAWILDRGMPYTIRGVFAGYMGSAYPI